MNTRREVTIYDIAEALNISASTVSRGLKDHPLIKKETKEKILLTAREMGYQQNTFASNLRKNSSNTIGVVVPRLDSYFMSKVISGIEMIANQNGYNLIINQSEESGKKEIACVETMYNSRVDGLLVSLASDTENISHLDLFYRKRIPLVFFDRIASHKQSVSILIDNFQAAYEATAHLANQGCKRIMHIGGNLSRNVYSDRYKGYLKALEEYGLDVNEELVFIHDLNEESGHLAVEKILSMKYRPDAVFASNDTTAVSVICSLKQKGLKVPEDFAVAGFNNDPLSRVVDPNLTTIDYPGKEMGEIAAKTLIDQIKNKKSSSDLNPVFLKHELIIRNSSLKKQDVDV